MYVNAIPTHSLESLIKEEILDLIKKMQPLANLFSSAVRSETVTIFYSMGMKEKL